MLSWYCDKLVKGFVWYFWGDVMELLSGLFVVVWGDIMVGDSELLWFNVFCWDDLWIDVKFVFFCCVVCSVFLSFCIWWDRFCIFLVVVF